MRTGRTGPPNVAATPSATTSPAKRMSLPGRTCWPPSACSSPCRGEGLVMAAELALATDPDMIERSADQAGFVVQACERAKAWLREALEHGGIEQIAEIKSQAEAVRVYTAQRQLGKDAQLAAAEIVRRAERGIGLAIRRGQQDRQIRRRGDRAGQVGGNGDDNTI